MTCDRCLPEQPCFNHQRAAELKAILAAKDHREALARGRARMARNEAERTGRGGYYG